MDPLIYDFNLYVTPNISVPPVLNLSQYDSTRTFIAHLKNDNGQPYVLTSGVTATVNGKNKFGRFSVEAICKDDTITFTPFGKATLEAGRIYATVQIIDENGCLTPLALILNIQRSFIQIEEDETSPGDLIFTLVLENMQVSLEDDGETLVFESRTNFINTNEVGD